MRNLIVLLAMLLWSAVPLAAQEDPAPAGHRIVAVGDLHGDYEAWRAIASAAGLADDGGRWAGGDTVLVQLGDITDRGPDSLKIIRHLINLEQEAQAAGGQVIVLLGNHEAMNVTGDVRYVHAGEYEAFRDRKSKQRREATWLANRDLIAAIYRKDQPHISVGKMKERWFAETPLGMLEHRRAWAPGGEFGEWAAQRPAALMIGTTLFVHGGLSAETSAMSIEAINARTKAALLPGEEVDRSALDDPLGPLWYRGNVMRGDDDEADKARPSREAELDIVLSRYGAERLVVAHTPSVRGIAASDDGKLIRVDTGISSYYGGVPSYLVIQGEEVTAHQRGADGEWTSRTLESPASGSDE